MKLHLNKLIISILTVLTSITLFESPIVYAENSLGIPDDITSIIALNSYTQPIPMDSGSYRDFEFPNNSETTYIGVKNTNTTYVYEETDYATFRNRLALLHEDGDYKNRGSSYSITYNKYYIYDSNHNYTDDYIITIEVLSCNYDIWFKDSEYSYSEAFDPSSTSNVLGRNGKVKMNGTTFYGGTRVINFNDDYTVKNFVQSIGQFQTFGSCRAMLAAYRKSKNMWFYLDSMNNSGASLGISFGNLQNHVYGSGGGSSLTADLYISDSRLPGFGYTGANAFSNNELLSTQATINKDNLRLVPCNPNTINDFVDTVHKNHDNYIFSYHRLLCSYLKADVEGTGTKKRYKLLDQMDDYGIFTSADALPSDPYSSTTYFGLNVTSSNDEYGTVNSVSGAYLAGDVVNLVATPTSNAYRFLRWSDGDTNAERELTISGNLDLQAIFVAKDQYNVTLNSVDEYAGHFEGEGTYFDGDIIDIKAIPYKGYEFSHWSDGNENQSRSITVDDNIDLTAYFFTGGSSGGKVDAGPIITVIIIAAFLLMLKGF